MEIALAVAVSSLLSLAIGIWLAKKVFSTSSQDASHFSQLLQNSAVLQEKISHLAERLNTMESGQRNMGQGVQAIEKNLAQTYEATGNLAATASAIRTELTRAKEDLSNLHTRAEARKEMEQQTSDSIKRLEAIIAGSKSKGIAGENILEAVFAQFPADWQVRNFRVGNKSVEFGLKLPNNLILPIDSKWAATALLEQWSAVEEGEEKERLQQQIENAVLLKAKEVKKYVDPALTVTFAVAVVPDSVFNLSSRIQPEIFQMNVVLISYSMFIPYLLLVFQTVLKSAHNFDLERLNAYLSTAQESMQFLQSELEGRFAKALTMLGNTRTEMSDHLSRINAGLTNLQHHAAQPEALPSPVISE